MKIQKLFCHKLKEKAAPTITQSHESFVGVNYFLELKLKKECLFEKDDISKI